MKKIIIWCRMRFKYSKKLVKAMKSFPTMQQIMSVQPLTKK
jgi:hypothetical protein